MLLFSATAMAAPLSRMSATAGFRVGDGASGGFVDLLLPVVTTAKGMIFINPRLSLEDHGENEVNVGAGWRQMAFGDSVVIGGNLYFDSRYTERNNRFNQLGVGVEVLSRWLDARANYYLPEDKKELIASETTETVDVSGAASYGDPYATDHLILQDYTLTTTTTTTRRLYERFESAMEGFDAEIGVRLPLPDALPVVRLFGGYYSFEDAFGKKVEGPKGRVEVRIGSFLTLDAEVFDDKELNGTSYYAGARFDTPFDLMALVSGANPFTGWNAPAQADLASRMSEMVMRDPRVQTGESGPEENEGARQVEAAEVLSRGTHTLLADVTFVNDDNTSGVEDGTAEHPYSEIQDGVDASGTNLNVYVFSGDYSSVTLLPGVTLWGEGTPVRGYGGRDFGGGAYPTIGGDSPAVTVVGDTRVTGFRITNADDNGIYGEIDAGTVIIDNNIIEVTGSDDDQWVNGIYLVIGGQAVDVNYLGAASASPAVVVTIADNVISSIGGYGNGIALENYGTLDAMIVGNSIVSEGYDNWGIMLDNYGGSLTMAVTDNVIDSGTIGLSVNNWGNGSVTANASGNTIAAGVIGMIFDNNYDYWYGSTQTETDGTMTVTVENNTVTVPDENPYNSFDMVFGMLFVGLGTPPPAVSGEGVIGEGPTTLSVTANGNSVTGGGIGMCFEIDGGTMVVSAAGNDITSTGMAGIEVFSVMAETDVTLAGNQVNVNGVAGVGIAVMDIMSDSTLSVTGNTLNLNGDLQTGLYTLALGSQQAITADDNAVNVLSGDWVDGFIFSNLSSDVVLDASGNSVTGAAENDMTLENLGGTFTVNAAAPGSGGDLSGLNNGMDVVYVPDWTAFTFLP
jgi:hypothetical protein